MADADASGRPPGEPKCPTLFFDRSRGAPPQPQQSNPTFSSLGTPKLTHLSFQTMAFMDSTPWSPHITTTHIEGKELMYTWTTLLTLLRLPCLRTLSIFWAIFLSPTDEQGVVKRIVAPELVHFRCFSEAVITHVLHFLQAPKLEVLVLKGEYMSYFSSPQSLIGGIPSHIPIFALVCSPGLLKRAFRFRIRSKGCGISRTCNKFYNKPVYLSLPGELSAMCRQG